MTMNRISSIAMPKWGIEMQEGTITAWHAEPGPGDKVHPQDVGA